jgi:hypothetical protein
LREIAKGPNAKKYVNAAPKPPGRSYSQIGELLSAESVRQVALGTGLFNASLLRFGGLRDFQDEIVGAAGPF